MPQIELMQADLPHTLYNFNKERTEVSDECERLNREAMAKSRARHAKRKAAAPDKSYTLEEVFNGAADE